MVGGFILSDPTFRYPRLGVSLERDLAALAGKDPLTLQVSLDTGVELLPEEQLSEEPAIQDSFTLLLILSEELQARTDTADVLYKVEEMQSEQWAWKKAELNKLQARTQVSSRALPSAPLITVPKAHELAEQDVWAPVVLSLWPKLPTGLQKAGRSSWSDQFRYEEKSPLGGQPVSVSCQLVYRLDKFVNTSHGVYANLLVLGTLSATPGQDPTIAVEGTFKGFVLVDPETGRTVGGEHRLEQQVLIRKPGLPVARATTFVGARYWRPRFHQASPGQTMPSAASTPQEAPTP